MLEGPVPFSAVLDSAFTFDWSDRRPSVIFDLQYLGYGERPAVGPEIPSHVDRCI